MRNVRLKVVKNWSPLPTLEPLTLALSWRLSKNGSVSNVKVLSDGKTPRNEILAIEAVKKSAPFPPLPPGSGDSVEVEFELQRVGGWQSVPQALKDFGAASRKLLHDECQSAGITYPPSKLTIIGLKEERVLLVFAGDDRMNLIGCFPLVSFSGVLGPKLKEGDLQIPEGIYRITGLSAGSILLALRMNYPNAMDRKNAALDHRTKLGGSILVHGGSFSTGCLVISNDDMKQVFVAVNDIGCGNTKLIIAPCDLTKKVASIDMQKQPRWLPALYESLKAQLAEYPMPGTCNLR